MWRRYAERPRLELPLTGADKVLQLTGAVVMAVFLVVVAATFSGLPEQIPVHFGLNGEPDDWGSRGEVLVLPLVALLQFALLSVLARFPHRYNYMVRITAANAERQYRLASRLLYLLSLLVLLLFFALYLASWAIANHHLERLPAPLLWLPLLAVGLLLIWYWLRSRQAR